MFLMRFTERAYTNYTEEDVLRSPNKAVRVTFSNSHFDPAVASRQYNESLDEWEYVEELGFEGMMLNEHHNTPTSLGAAMNLEAAILARITRKPKIVLMGNPLPIHDNPLRLAEELAEIDMISGGRLVSGFVRGGGTETWSTNANPVHNRERFEEAHDLIIKAWTTPGPFRWEGKHYHFRVVNPFQVPLQKPHPPVWIPGSGSAETVIWCAERRYPYFYLGIVPDSFGQMQQIYTEEAASEFGYEAGPEHFRIYAPNPRAGHRRKGVQGGARVPGGAGRRRARPHAEGVFLPARLQPTHHARVGIRRRSVGAGKSRPAQRPLPHRPHHRRSLSGND